MPNPSAKGTAPPQAQSAGAAARVPDKEPERRPQFAPLPDLLASPRFAGGGRFAPIPRFGVVPTQVLEVSEPDDPLEKEAERTAERVVRRLSVSPGGAPAGDAPAGDAPPPATSRATVARIHRASLVEVAAATAGPADEPARGGLIVEDKADTTSPGQMRKTPFLAKLRQIACDTAERELQRVGRSARGCPYIEEMLGRYARRPAAMLERAVRRYAPATANATRAEEYFPAVAERLARGVAEWARTGRMPDGLPDELTPGRLGDVLEVAAGVGRALGAVGRALFKGKDGGPRTGVDAAALSARLGPGRSLDGTVRARMEWAFGRDFGGVRVHADGPSAELARSLDARAFTVGEHVAFGAGELHPGDPAGDALLAHELAHVAQQAGGAAQAAAPDEPLEADADHVAADAVVALHAPHARADARAPAPTARRPRLRAGLQLQRCGGGGAKSIKDLSKIPTPPPATLPPEYTVEGQSKQEDSTTIFFERGSSIPDSFQVDEKIDALVSSEGPLRQKPLRIIGVNSVDEPNELSMARATHVSELLQGHGHDAKREAIDGHDRGRERVDYRNVRVAAIEPSDTTESSVPEATTRPCAADEAPFQEARERASTMVGVAIGKLATPLPAEVTPLFETFFGPATPTRVSDMRDNLTKLQHNIDNRMKSPDGHVCATASHPFAIRGWAAADKGQDDAALMTLCPIFFKISDVNTRAEILVHEGTHGTTWKGSPDATGTKDVTYKWMRVVKFLTPDEMAANADNVAFFVTSVQPDAVAPSLGPAKEDSLSTLDADPTTQTDVRRALAFLQQRLINAHKYTGVAYDHLVRAAASAGAILSDGLWTEISPIFGFSDPAAPPVPADRFKVAAIVDRLTQQVDILRTPVSVTKGSAPDTTWMGSSVTLGADFFAAAASHEAQVQLFIAAMMKATKGITPAQIPQYVTLIEKLRIHDGKPVAP